MTQVRFSSLLEGLQSLLDVVTTQKLGPFACPRDGGCFDDTVEIALLKTNRWSLCWQRSVATDGAGTAAPHGQTTGTGIPAKRARPPPCPPLPPAAAADQSMNTLQRHFVECMAQPCSGTALNNYSYYRKFASS